MNCGAAALLCALPAAAAAAAHLGEKVLLGNIRLVECLKPLHVHSIHHTASRDAVILVVTVHTAAAAAAA